MPRPEVRGIHGVRGGVAPGDGEFRDRAFEPVSRPQRAQRLAATKSTKITKFKDTKNSFYFVFLTSVLFVRFVATNVFVLFVYSCRSRVSRIVSRPTSVRTAAPVR